MSFRYWVSDTHFSHGNIAIYEDRPWLNRDDIDPVTGRFRTTEQALATARRMNAGLVKSINERLDPYDRVIHVGDFGTRGRAKNTEGLREPVDAMLRCLTGRWTLLEGNHDDNNGVKCAGQYLVAKVGQYTAFAGHWPVDPLANHYSADLMAFVRNHCDMVICGHVHHHWSEQVIEGVWHCNVGVDVRKYAPISDSEVIGLYEKHLRKQKEHNA